MTNEIKKEQWLEAIVVFFINGDHVILKKNEIDMTLVFKTWEKSLSKDEYDLYLKFNSLPVIGSIKLLNSDYKVALKRCIFKLPGK